MTSEERAILVKNYLKENGWDFFLVDSSVNGTVRAAPFHIQEERDVEVFVNFASNLIKWEPCHNMSWSNAAKSKYE